MTLWNDLKDGKKETPDHLKKGTRTLIEEEPESEAPEDSMEEFAKSLGLSTEQLVVKLLEASGGTEYVRAAQAAVKTMLNSVKSEQAVHMVAFFTARAVTDIMKTSTGAPNQALEVLAETFEECARSLRKAAKKRVVKK